MRVWMLEFVTIIALGLSLNFSAAIAASVNAAIDVTATVGSSCDVAVSNVDFGPVSGSFAIDTNVSSGVIGTTCTRDLPYTIAIGSSNLGEGTRRMTDGLSHYINYSLYSDSGYTSLWGDGTVLGLTVSDTGTGLIQSHPIYGRIPAGQAPVPAGNYSDLTVPVTVSY